MQLNNPELFLWGFLFGFGDTNLPWRSGWPAGVWVPEESLHSLAEFHHLKRRVEPVHRHTNGPVQLHTKVLAACVNISASEVEEGTFIFKDRRFLMIEMPGPSSTHCSFEIYLQLTPFQLTFSNRCSYVGFILFPVKYFQLAGKKKTTIAGRNLLFDRTRNNNPSGLSGCPLQTSNVWFLWCCCRSFSSDDSSMKGHNLCGCSWTAEQSTTTF